MAGKALGWGREGLRVAQVLLMALNASVYYCVHGLSLPHPLKVLGLVRVPLYTLPNGLGFPAFLNNQFIGNSKHQLLTVLRERGLMEERQLEDAIHTSSTVNTVVTAEEVNY